MDCSLITQKLMGACQEALQDLKSNSSYGFDFENIKVPQEIEKLTIKYAKYWYLFEYVLYMSSLCLQGQSCKNHNLLLKSILRQDWARSSDLNYNFPRCSQLITKVYFLNLPWSGNVGGLVGLLTGFSVISIIELFYHIMLTLKDLCLMRSK